MKTNITPGALAVEPGARALDRPRAVRRRETRILSIGTAVPGSGFPQSKLVEFMKRAHGADARLSRVLDALYRRSGIDRRYSCLADFGRSPAAFEFFSPASAPEEAPSTSRRMAAYRAAAGPLALEAVLAAALRLPSFDARQVTHLVVASCTGFHAPGIDVDLINALGISPRVARTLIGFQGCQAGLSSLRVADAICRADPQAFVLVVCVELCTLHFQILPTEDNLLANSLFADGACAVLLRAGRPEDGGGGRQGLVVSRSASWLQAGTEEEMAWSVGDRGFEMRLSGLVPRLLGIHAGRFLEEALGIGGSALRALRFWAVHPGGPAILDEIERALALDPDLLAPSRAVLREFGNMSSPTVLFVLDRIWRAMEDGGDREPERGIALAFGPGLTLEAILFEARP